MVGSRVVFNKTTGRYEPIRQANSRVAARPPYQPGKVGSETEGGYRRVIQNGGVDGYGLNRGPAATASAVNDSKEFRKGTMGQRQQAGPDTRRMPRRVDTTDVRGRRNIGHRNDDDRGADIYQARRQKLKQALMPKKKRK